KIVLVVLIWVVAVSGLICLVAVSGWVSGDMLKDAVPLALALILFLALVGVIVGGVFMTGSDTACPECEKFWARKPCGRELINEKLVYKTVMRTTEWHSGGYSGSWAGGPLHSGKTWGETKRKERVKVLQQTFRNRYECKYCGHRW